MKAILLALTLGGVFLSGGGAYAEVFDLYYFWNGTHYQQYWPVYDLYAYQNSAQYPEQLYPILTNWKGNRSKKRIKTILTVKRSPLH